MKWINTLETPKYHAVCTKSEKETDRDNFFCTGFASKWSATTGLRGSQCQTWEGWCFFLPFHDNQIIELIFYFFGYPTYRLNQDKGSLEDIYFFFSNLNKYPGFKRPPQWEDWFSFYKTCTKTLHHVLERGFTQWLRLEGRLQHTGLHLDPLSWHPSSWP